MGARGAIIMSFFGALFAAMTLYWQFAVLSWSLLIPFVVFVVIFGAAIRVLCKSGNGAKPSEQAERAIMWSSIGEGVGLFLAANIVINLHHPGLLLPAMALVIGVHFLPIARAASFPPFYALGAALILAAMIGFVVVAPAGGAVSGFMAAVGLWVASAIAVHRDNNLKKREATTPAIY